MQLVGWWRRENALPGKKSNKASASEMRTWNNTLFAGQGGLYAVFV